MADLKQIVKVICLAQIASDAGKRKYRIKLPDSDRATAMGYRLKNTLIDEAISLINGGRPCGVTYWVEKTPDQNGFPSVLVTFDMKVNGKRYQTSFHNPGKRGGGLDVYASKGRKTHWVRAHSKSAPDSAEAIFEVAKMVGLNPIWIG